MRKFLFLILALGFLSSCNNKFEDNRTYPPADLVFYETYTQQEFQPYWVNALKVSMDVDSSEIKNLNDLSNYDLSRYVQPSGDYGLVYVLVENQSKVANLLNSKRVKACFPEDAEIMWSYKAENINGNREKAYSLFVVHKKGVKPRLTGKDLENAEIEEDPNTMQLNIMLTMTEKGTEKWSEMTSDNINRIIVMSINGKVLSAPRVLGEITGGKTQISGNFNLEEAKELVGGIKASIR
jgi:SecD/SecF fusion protein